MNTFESSPGKRVMLTAIAAVLALGLAACGEKSSTSGDKFGQNLERGNAVTPPSSDRTNTAQGGTDQPGMNGKAADTANTHRHKIWNLATKLKQSSCRSVKALYCHTISRWRPHTAKPRNRLRRHKNVHSPLG